MTAISRTLAREVAKESTMFRSQTADNLMEYLGERRD
jgi:hypothetical protein